MRRPDRASNREHTLPHPGAAIDAHMRPFVGNASVEDNLCECVRVAVWSAVGHAGSRVTVSFSDGAVHLAGVIDSSERHDLLLEAASRVAAPTEVIDELSVEASGPSPAAALESPVIHASMVRVREYCSLSDASLSAAINDAIGRLDAAFVASDLPAPTRLLVLYRNRTRSTVTLDVGAFAEPSPKLARHGLDFGQAPPAELVQVSVGPGAERLVAGQSRLLHEAGRAEHGAVWWEILEARQFRPWRGLPEATLHLAS